ncbi:phosphoribosylglycinamide formyltransferase-1 [Quadrisphaera sp. DSM 44207]|nr:phosphoribosylglycinamide formyltransferase [Quadrisphaera sp. DSM 44207]SDQ12771.1 phosphoribosylglycinamide formyltransferase-1 [Quadrisphaera sp. DSM 44207]
MTPPSTPARLVVLVSGGGTLLQALLDASRDACAPFSVAAVGADADAPGLQRARAAGVPTFVVRLADHPDRAAWDAALAAELVAREPDLVVCAGFMRVLGPAVLGALGGRVVNTHPALLPAFPGVHGVRDALAAGVRVTGATAHLVDAGVDTGPVLDQRAVRVEDGDDEAALHERIKVVEREMLVDVLTRMVRTGWTVTGRKVTFP